MSLNRWTLEWRGRERSDASQFGLDAENRGIAWPEMIATWTPSPSIWRHEWPDGSALLHGAPGRGVDPDHMPSWLRNMIRGGGAWWLGIHADRIEAAAEYMRDRGDEWSNPWSMCPAYLMVQPNGGRKLALHGAH